jgi:hypothetical protein
MADDMQVQSIRSRESLDSAISPPDTAGREKPEEIQEIEPTPK